ncbi:MAG: hypothetical protein A2W05_07125 [Candidatus Schekmanbacteria bacterium RBG_16_38_10]|uniref:N4-gp56 family major capsid protein n=1 Tax=Candidatus Schekmanbacteria bacterium RBG_16_38_10 TaxID=1817879 RepID=A0A1F7RZJ3_9BACT|nr:MAG: hypothetical protein A2W05_07125 [Candidatus Schekmanbacteria bacterium RBG_16_38_10]
MALPTDTMGAGVGGSLTADIPLLWGSKINDYYRYNLTLAQFFIDRSEELADGGSDVYTPNIVAMSTAAKSNSVAVTLNNPIQTKNTLTVSTWKESSFMIEDREMAQLKKSYYLQNKLAKSAAWEVAQDLDDAIAAQFTNFTTAGNIVGLASANVADSTLLAAIAILETAGVPVYGGDTAWIMHPNTFYRQIGSVDKLTLWQNTQTELPRSKAPTRSLYSIPVIVSPAVPLGAGAVGENSARLNLLANNDAIHWARMTLPGGAAKSFTGENGVRIQESYQEIYLATLVTVDLCYGTMLNQPTGAVKIRSHSVAVGL